MLGAVLVPVRPVVAAEANDDGAEIVSKYLESAHQQQESLKGKQMEVQIEADLPKLHKTGRMNALRLVSSLGKISYKMLGFSGDTTVKNDVIARYLTAETQGQRDTTQYAITPDNYKFKYKGILDQDTRKVYVFELKPRESRIGLFKGELWLDTKTYMPVRESGRFVKNPSVFLKKVEFTREYELQDGISIPKHIKSTVDTRIVGRADISIDYMAPTKLQTAEPAAANNTVQQAHLGQ